MSADAITSASNENTTPASGTWVTEGDVPADFNPTSYDSGALENSDCAYREYGWSFGGTAAGHTKIFSATLNASIELSGKVIGISVSSDDNATVTLGSFAPVKSSLGKPASGCFFNDDGAPYSGSFPLSVEYDTVGGPWSINVIIRVATPKDPVPAERECPCGSDGCSMSARTENGSVDFS